MAGWARGGPPRGWGGSRCRSQSGPQAGPQRWAGKVSLATGPPGCPLEGKKMFASVLRGWGVRNAQHHHLQEGAGQRRGAQSAAGTESHSLGAFGTWPFQSWGKRDSTRMCQSSWPRGCASQGWEDCSWKNSAVVASGRAGKGASLCGRWWWLRKRSHATCQFIQHFGKQLLAGRVKNEEFLEPERQVPRKSTCRQMAGHKSPR